jgi:hypothetical protein
MFMALLAVKAAMMARPVPAAIQEIEFLEIYRLRPVKY